MRRLKRGVIAAAITGLMATTGPVLGTGTAVAENSGVVRSPLAPIWRTCAHEDRDWTRPAGSATAMALISSTGSGVTAEVNMATADPHTRYEVKLIQAPRVSWQPCNPGDPGVVGGVIHTDVAGSGSVTLHGGRMSGGTGAWVEIFRPAPFSQIPAEVYTSGFIAKI